MLVKLAIVVGSFIFLTTQCKVYEHSPESTRVIIMGAIALIVFAGGPLIKSIGGGGKQKQKPSTGWAIVPAGAKRGRR